MKTAEIRNTVAPPQAPPFQFPHSPDLKPARLQSLAAQQYPADRLVARLSGHAFCDWLFPEGSSEGSTPPRVKIVLFSIQDKIAPVYAAVAGTLADAGVDFGVSEPNDAVIAQYFNLTKVLEGGKEGVM